MYWLPARCVTKGLLGSSPLKRARKSSTASNGEPPLDRAASARSDCGSAPVASAAAASWACSCFSASKRCCPSTTYVSSRTQPDSHCRDALSSSDLAENRCAAYATCSSASWRDSSCSSAMSSGLLVDSEPSRFTLNT
eukprot:scaffold9308_cov72-Phaeocystis_antarctica.AAC.3